MTTYVIARYGSNAANQSMCNRAILGTVEAKSRQEATDVAPSELAATVYNNQYLEAIPYSRASKADRDAAEEANYSAQAERQYLAALEQEAGAIKHHEYLDAQEREIEDRERYNKKVSDPDAQEREALGR